MVCALARVYPKLLVIKYIFVTFLLLLFETLTISINISPRNLYFICLLLACKKTHTQNCENSIFIMYFLFPFLFSRYAVFLPTMFARCRFFIVVPEKKEVSKTLLLRDRKLG